jgi:actin related protein 2/3 complex subunit 2
MLLLEFHNKIIEDTLLERFNITDGKYESLEAIVADFDGVLFHLFTDANNKNLLSLSMSIKCWGELEKYGVDDVMKKQYSGMVQQAESGYNITIQIDTAKPPQDKASYARNVALLKRHALAAPFYKVFADIEAKKGGPSAQLLEVNYRDDEAFYLKPETDRCIVIFSVRFKDADDIVFAKVFLQEYADARRTMSNAPAVSYAQKEPPMELKGVRNLRVGDGQGYVSFVLFQPHIAAAKKEKTIDNMMTFRNYLHYHLKCSKAHLHTRMRNKVRTFLQVLNRAKSEPESKEKKTMSGRTFKRADDEAPTLEEGYNI